METIFYVLGPEQAENMIRDLQASLNAGAGSILILSSNKPEAQRKLDRLKSDWAKGKGTIGDIPEPDIIVHSSIFTIALPSNLDKTLEMVEEWASDSEGDHE